MSERNSPMSWKPALALEAVKRRAVTHLPAPCRRDCHVERRRVQRAFTRAGNRSRNILCFAVVVAFALGSVAAVFGQLPIAYCLLLILLLAVRQLPIANRLLRLVRRSRSGLSVCASRHVEIRVVQEKTFAKTIQMAAIRRES